MPDDKAEPGTLLGRDRHDGELTIVEFGAVCRRQLHQPFVGLGLHPGSSPSAHHLGGPNLADHPFKRALLLA